MLQQHQCRLNSCCLHNWSGALASGALQCSMLADTMPYAGLSSCTHALMQVAGGQAGSKGTDNGWGSCCEANDMPPVRQASSLLQQDRMQADKHALMTRTRLAHKPVRQMLQSASLGTQASGPTASISLSGPHAHCLKACSEIGVEGVIQGREGGIGQDCGAPAFEQPASAAPSDNGGHGMEGALQGPGS